jgi:cytochrome c peroxidase
MTGLALVASLGCAGPTAGSTDSGAPLGWDWGLPDHIAVPEVPDNNPMSVEKVALGRVLFHDFQLSIDGGRSCGICHEQKKAFTDGFVKAIGTTGESHTRNTPSVLNVAWRGPLTWLDPGLFSLEEQLLGPLLGTEPIEMGMGENEELLLARLTSFDPYPEMFEAAWPSESMPIDMDHMAQAIAAYQRTLYGFASPYDRHLAGDQDALGDSAQRGLALFFSESLACGSCHNGPLLDRPLDEDGELLVQPGFFNTGQYNIDGLGSYPADDPGLVAITGDSADTGAFRTPSLRSVAITEPWNHDGTTSLLSAVLDNYARGGRLVGSGPNPGDGALSPYLDPRIQGFEMNETDREDLLAFLEALGDPAILASDPPQDPFCRGAETDPIDCITPRDLATDDVIR